MHLHLVNFFTVVYFIIPAPSKSNAQNFILEYNSKMMKFIKDLPENPGVNLKSQFFYAMSLKDRIKYCNEAKDFAGLDVVTSITNVPLKYLASIYMDVLLECRTLPISYLWIPHRFFNDGKIIIMLWENKFEKYHFEVRITKSEPVLYSESKRSISVEMSVADFLGLIRSRPSLDEYVEQSRVSQKMSIADFLNIIGSTSFEEKRVIDNRLSHLNEREAIELCIAAKQYLHQPNESNDNAQKVPVWQNDRVEPAQIFDFGEEIGDHVAVQCPIIPSMYVYFKNPAAIKRDLVITLVQK